MFRKKQKSDAIAAKGLFVSVHEPGVRRRKGREVWLEVVLVVAAVAVVVGAVWLFGRWHRPSFKPLQTQLQTNPVVQPPQDRNDSEQPQTNAPETTPGSDSTNGSSVQAPAE